MTPQSQTGLIIAMSDYRIREAKREDCTAIRELIQELADYENAPDGPKINAKVLEEDGFGPDPAYHSYVAETNDLKVIGYVIYYYSYSTWEGRSVYMEDLYVTAHQRTHGVGTALMRKVAQTALEKGCSRLDFAVLDWNIARQFYEKVVDAHDLTQGLGWHLYRVNKDNMLKLAAD